MNANVPAPRPPIAAGGQVGALIPQSMDEAFRVANAIALSGLAPKGVEKPEQVLVAIMAGAELGFAPFQSIQSFAVINGKPNIWGDALPALLWSRGFKIKERFDNDDEPTKAFCRITRPDGEEIERTFSVADAKKAGLLGKQGPWQQYQKRMLQMRARAFAARDGAADVLRGMQVAEEVQDYGHVREVRAAPVGTGMLAKLEARSAASTGFDPDHVARETGAAQADHDPSTGEVIDAEVEETTAQVGEDDFPGDRQTDQAATQPHSGDKTISERIDDFKGRLAAAPNTTKAKAIWSAAERLRADVDAKDPERLPEMENAFNARYAELEDAEREASGQ
ncbi:hypothetical protein [Phenylobacterium koreense]|uniref:Recombinase RecT n=1 Tax=Phenylobacterium koreense TaxID=266125 RepID=A0ABV2EJP9_9CAUL